MVNVTSTITKKRQNLATVSSPSLWIIERNAGIKALGGFLRFSDDLTQRHRG
jgi:hypothetical protein